jgi:hypothetical protein
MKPLVRQLCGGQYHPMGKNDEQFATKKPNYQRSSGCVIITLFNKNEGT